MHVLQEIPKKILNAIVTEMVSINNQRRWGEFGHLIQMRVEMVMASYLSSSTNIMEHDSYFWCNSSNDIFLIQSAYVT